MKNYAIIVAGGRGKRMGCNKCFLPLAGRPVIIRTIEAFVSSGVTDGIVCVVGDQEEVALLHKMLCDHGLKDQVQHIIPTEGPHRQEGVWSGIKALRSFPSKDDDIIMIHNGANPLVKSSEIRQSIEAAKTHGASVCAIPVKDTIKRVDGELFVVETLDRKGLWAMQTPQTMRYSIATQGFEKAFRDNFFGTDDVQLAERIGCRVKIVECSPENFKITTPDDLVLAEKILCNRK